MKKIQFKLFSLLTPFIFLFSFSCAAQQTIENAASGTDTAPTKQYICVGDSITNGHGNTSFQAYPHQFALMLGGANSYKDFGPPDYAQRPLPEGWLIQNPANLTSVINLGINSQRIQTMLERVGTQVGSRLGNANESTVILLGGINDAAQGRSAEQIQADWAAYGNWCRANNVKLYIGTMTAANNHPFDLIRVQANIWLRANWQSFADKLIDFERNEALADSTNLTYFYGDTVHPNAAGDFRMAQIVNAVINGSYQAPVIANSTLRTGLTSGVYSQSLSVLGGDGVIIWSHRSGALPSGIVFNAATRSFEGTPTAIGTFPNIIIRATDATGDFHERTFSLVIAENSVFCNPKVTRNCPGYN